MPRGRRSITCWCLSGNNGLSSPPKATIGARRPFQVRTPLFATRDIPAANLRKTPTLHCRSDISTLCTLCPWGPARVVVVVRVFPSAETSTPRAPTSVLAHASHAPPAPNQLIPTLSISRRVHCSKSRFEGDIRSAFDALSGGSATASAESLFFSVSGAEWSVGFLVKPKNLDVDQCHTLLSSRP